MWWTPQDEAERFSRVDRRPSSRPSHGPADTRLGAPGKELRWYLRHHCPDRIALYFGDMFSRNRLVFRPHVVKSYQWTVMPAAAPDTRFRSRDCDANDGALSHVMITAALISSSCPCLGAQVAKALRVGRFLQKLRETRSLLACPPWDLLRLLHCSQNEALHCIVDVPDLGRRRGRADVRRCLRG